MLLFTRDNRNNWHGFSETLEKLFWLISILIWFDFFGMISCQVSKLTSHQFKYSFLKVSKKLCPIDWNWSWWVLVVILKEIYQSKKYAISSIMLISSYYVIILVLNTTLNTHLRKDANKLEQNIYEARTFVLFLRLNFTENHRSREHFPLVFPFQPSTCNHGSSPELLVTSSVATKYESTALSREHPP